MRAVLLGLLLVSYEVFGATRLTLKEAFDMVAVSNPELILSDFDHKISEGVLKEEQSIFFPTLGIEGGYQKFESDLEDLSGTFMNVFGEYKFDLAGSQYFRYRFSGIDAEVSKLKRDLVKKQLQWEIESKFSRALYLQESIKLYKIALEQNVQFAQLANKKKSSGLASEADLIEFDLHESILKSDLEEVSAEFSEAQNDLKTALGMESADALELNGKLEHFHIVETLEQLKAKLKQSSGKGRIASLEAEKASYLKSASYGGFLPELSLKATYGRRGVDEPVGPEKTFFVIARWELFSGFRDFGNYQRALAIQQKAEFEKRQLDLNLPRELETEFKKFAALQNRVDLESQNRDRSKNYLSTVMSEYRRGVKNSADLRAASSQLLEASLRDLKYRYEGIKQKHILQTLVGETIRFEEYSTKHKVN